MTATTTAKNVHPFVTEMREDRARLQAFLSSLGCLSLSDGYIIRCQGLCMTFDVDGAGVLSNARVAGGPDKAMRFTRNNAARIAPAVKNGNGTVGESIHVRDALQESIAELGRLIDQLEAHA